MPMHVLIYPYMFKKNAYKLKKKLYMEDGEWCHCRDSCAPTRR